MTIWLTLNSNLVDNLAKKGLDAKLKIGGEDVGIEITTLNTFIGEWILIERLTEVLSSKNILADKSVSLTCNCERVINETRQNGMDNYIEKLSSKIETMEVSGLKKMDIEDVSVEFCNREAGTISWNYLNDNPFPWLDCLTDKLLSSLTSSNKKR